jgi:general secretion pathway protein G
VIRIRKLPSLGFTLLELLVVLVILGLLAGIVAPNLLKNVDKSETATARAQIDALGKALDQYFLDNGKYPSTQEGLDALIRAPSSATRWDGPYLKRAVPLDPWQTPYVYRSPGQQGREMELLSYGADRMPGGDKQDADITNW